MTFERRPPEAMREAEMHSIKTMVDEALELKEKFATLSDAVSQVLKNHKIQGPDRTQKFKAIMAEMTKRSQIKAKARKTVVQTKAEPNSPTHFQVTPAVMRDAENRQKNERIIPRSTWASDHPENSPD